MDEEELIERMLRGARTIAVVGCSADPWRPSNEVSARLQRAGFRVIPVNPDHAGEQVLGEHCYASLADVPEPVDIVNVFRRSEFTPDVVREAVAVGAPAVFLQQGIAHPQARRIAEEAGIAYVEDRCIAVERAKYGVTH